MVGRFKKESNIGNFKNLIDFYKDKIIIAVSHRGNIANLFQKKIQL